MDWNDFAKEITLQEGKKESISIGQVKETLKLVMHKLNEHTDEEIISMVRDYPE